MATTRMTHSGNRFLNMSEMTDNAQYIMDYLIAKGWTKNAISGMLGNMQTESTINPGIWQSLDEGNTRLGFGLVQWTPATKYLDWAKSKGLTPTTLDANLQRILYEVENNIQWIKSGYTFKQFTQSKDTPYNLGLLFLQAYERPKESNQPVRGIQAETWYKVLSADGSIVPPDEPGDNPGIPPGDKPQQNKQKDLIHLLLCDAINGWKF